MSVMSVVRYAAAGAVFLILSGGALSAKSESASKVVAPASLTSIPSPQVQPPADVAAAVADVSADSPISLESSLSLRDPFRRPKLKRMGENDEGGKVPELERYTLEEFSLVGVITGTKKNKALLSLPGGKMVIVQENTVLGPRHGVVTRIVPGAVFVQEKVVNLLGQEEKIDTIIEFKEDSQQRTKQ